MAWQGSQHKNEVRCDVGFCCKQVLAKEHNLSNQYKIGMGMQMRHFGFYHRVCMYCGPKSEGRLPWQRGTGARIVNNQEF